MKFKMFLLLTICLFASGSDASTTPSPRFPGVETRYAVGGGLAAAQSSPRSVPVAAAVVLRFPLVHVLCFVGSLICYILVLIRMFERGLIGLGIACVALTLCCGIGGLVAFVYGWMNAAEWRVKNAMVVWTCIVVVHLAFVGSFISMHGFHMPVMPGR